MDKFKHLTAGKQRRTFKLNEIRMVDDENDPRIEGYASVFDQPSEDLGGFREFVRPGAFKKTIQEADIRALFNHDPNYVIGRNKANTLQLAEDSTGLEIVARPPDTSWARDLRVSMERRDIDQMSFGFETIRDEWRNEGDEIERDLLEVRLFDVSVVTYPAYPQTNVQARSYRDLLTGIHEATLSEDEIRGLIAELLGSMPSRPEVDLHRVDMLRRQLDLELIRF